MYYNYKMLDINGNGEIFDIIDLNVNAKRCRISKEDLLKTMRESKVGQKNMKVGHGQVVRLSEMKLISNAMLTY